MIKKEKIATVIIVFLVIAITVTSTILLRHMVNKEPEPIQSETPATQSELPETDRTYVKTSTASWRDNAMLGDVAPENIHSISFVKENNKGSATEAWIFDGFRCYRYDNDVVFVIGADIVKVGGSFERAFAGLPNLERINGLERIDTSGVSDMSYMFEHCESLRDININALDMTNVSSITGMFNGCKQLQKIDMGGVVFEGEYDTSYLFAECQSLQEIYLPQIESITNAERMFYAVGTLAESATILIGDLNTQACASMEYMFAESRLADYKIAERLNTDSLVSAKCMFCNSKVEYIDLSNWNTPCLTDTSAMFYSAMFLKKCYLNGWDVSTLRDCSSMFELCTSMQYLLIEWHDMEILQSACAMFKKCVSLSNLDCSAFNGVKIGDAREMFAFCIELDTLYCDGFSADASDNMFKSCQRLVSGVESILYDISIAKDVFTPSSHRS